MMIWAVASWHGPRPTGYPVLWECGRQAREHGAFPCGS